MGDGLYKALGIFIGITILLGSCVGMRGCIRVADKSMNERSR